MTMFLSRDEKELYPANLTAFRLDDGDMLLVGSVKDIDEAGEWLGLRGISEVSFDPANDPDKYNEFMFVGSAGDDGSNNAIRLYNK